MPPNSKKSKKKSKSKQHSKKAISSEVQAQLYDETNDYPTSRVIKRAPNGDVIVESLPNEEEFDEEQTKSQSLESPMAFTLDSHWESLGPEEKKSILRIEKDEVFDVIRNYQNNHNCNCSVCGRRHMAMDQEMERIYNTLYDLDRERDPEINPVKFHLSIIKELQNSKAQQQREALSCEAGPSDEAEGQEDSDSGTMRDDVVKYFLSSNAADSLKEEVMHFKRNKQQHETLPKHVERKGFDDHSTIPINRTTESNTIRTPSVDDNLSEKTLPKEGQAIVPADNGELQAKYMKFAKTFVSSHPKIAKEYVSRMMMYPDMRALTDDLMNNNGQGFVKAIESFVAQKQNPHSQSEDQSGSPDNLNTLVEARTSGEQTLGDAKDFTTMLHNGKPLTPEEYANLQRHVADRMTNSYDAQRKEFKEVSQLERELFTRFMFGEDRKRFGDLIMQSFREKFDDQYGNAAIGASLAAAAATTASPIDMPGHDEISEDYVFDHVSDEDGDELESNDYDESYDDYSDYGDENDVEQGDDDDDVRSEYDVEDESRLTIQREKDHRCCAHDSCMDQQRTYHGNRVQENGTHQEQTSDRYHPHQEHGDEYEDENEKYDSSLDEAERLEEGRKLIQIAITKLLQGRIMESYHEKQAENNRLKLLQELEAEELKKKAKEEKKHKKREKEKEKKKAQQLAKEEEKRRKEEEAELLKKEAEERERQRREAQRKKVEEVKRKKDEERRRKLEEQRRREEEQERHRKAKEELKRKRDEEKRARDEERKRIEEGKRQKEEMKLQEQQRQKAEEEKYLKVQQAAEIHNNTLNKMPGLTADVNLEPPSSHKPLFTPLQYSAPSPNIPYGNNIQPLPPYRSSNVNDDIMNIVSSATASKSVSASSGLQNLLDVRSGVPNDQFSQPLISNSEQLYGASNLMQTGSYPNESIAYSNMNCLIPPASSSQNSVSSGLSGQNFGLSSWNSYGSNNNLLKGFQQIPLDGQKAQRHRSTSSFNPNNAEPENEEYLTEEMTNIANMLSSAGLEDHSDATGAGSFRQGPVWGSQRDRSSLSLSNSLAPGDASSRGNEIGVDASCSKHISHPDNPIMRSSVQQNSIWDQSTKNTISTTPGDMDPLAGKLRSNTYAPNIWGPAHVSFLDGSSDITNSTTMQGSNENERINGTGGQENKDNVIIDNIYKTYLAFSSPGSSDYVSATTIHQNSICRTLDYPSFVSYLLSMHSSHNCDVLAGPSGSITHVRMAGPQNITAQSTSRKSTDGMINGLYFTPSDNKIPTLLSECPPSSVASSTMGNGTGFGSQYFNLPHSTNHSSLTSNIWS